MRVDFGTFCKFLQLPPSVKPLKTKVLYFVIVNTILSTFAWFMVNAKTVFLLNLTKLRLLNEN